MIIIKSRQADKMAAREAILATARANNAEFVRTLQGCDKTYINEYTRFCKWVTDQPSLETIQVPFITRTNVDHYFSLVIAKKKGIRNSISRVKSALQFIAKHRERVGEGFLVSSPIVEEALLAQKVHQSAVGGVANAGTDPHKGLKDILPLSDKLLIMIYIYASREDWGPAGVNFCWGQNGAVRGASNRKLKLCDIRLSFGFGPEESGRHARAILLIMRRGNVHKDRHETDDQVCCWRHKHYVLCSVFATALYVISSVTLNPTLSFLHPNKKARAPWWEVPLIDWEEYSEASNSTREIYKNTGIKSCKLTHHRTAAIQHGGFEGLTPSQINTMTSHMIDKQHSAYQSVTEREVSKILCTVLLVST